MNPLISIIVPVYNVKEYVSKCLESLQNQIYGNIEILIVDDGATDGSGKICDEFAKNESRARVFHKENGGLSDARNFGIKKAKGEIIAFVDSDDYVKKNYISDMYNKMTVDGADIVICGYDKIIPPNKILTGEQATVKLLTEQDNIEIVAWNKLYKKSLFIDNNIYFPVGEIHEDTLTTYKILSKAKKVSYLSESLYVYVEREESITNTEDIKERLSMRERAAKEAITYFKNNSDLKQAADISLLWAKYNYLNYAISGDIYKKYEQETLKWLRDNVNKYKDNKYISKKLKIYNILSTKFGGVFYKGLKRI